MSLQTRCAQTARLPRQRIEQALKKHHYLIVPMPLLNALNQEKLSPVAKDLYLRYLQDAMCRSQPDDQQFDSLISTDLAAQLLGVTRSAVRKANRQLESTGLIKRRQRTNPNGRSLPSVTRVMLPTAFDKECENAPTRQPRPVERPETSPLPDLPPIKPSPALTEEAPRVNVAPLALKKKIQTTEQHIQECKAQLKEAVQQKKGDQQIKWLSRLNQAEASLLALHRALERTAYPGQSVNASASTPNSASPSSSITPRPAPPPSRSLAEPQLTRLWNRLRALPGLSNPKEVYQEVVFQITQGVYAEMAIAKAVNICLKLVRNNKWRRPAGYQPIQTVNI